MKRSGHLRGVLTGLLLAATVVIAAATNAPSIPRPTSPVAYFRELLAMSDAERAAELGKRPAPQREALAAKIEEYSALPADERELRLRATELRYYLVPLMHARPDEYEALLRNVSEDVRELVESRLEQWKLIPPTLKDQLIENEATLRLFSRMNPLSAPEADELMSQLPASQRQQISADMERWLSLSPGEQSQLMGSFNHFFELTAAEKKRALKTLSPEEQMAMEAALERFAHLPPSQRVACVQAFQKFAAMSTGERAQFLRNAERWKAMSPDERQQWRDVVDRLSQMPPLPPGIEPEPVLVGDTPPLPIGFVPPGTQTN